jgi:F-type H+-transporting ATPase subunit b
VISVDWTLLVQFVNFIVLMIVLNILLYRPLRSVIERRRETADQAHGKARDLQVQIEEKIARYEEKLQAAKMLGNQEKTALRQAGAAEEAGIIGKAREEAAVRLQDVKNKVAEAAATARQQLKSDTDALSGEIASKILGRAL